MKIAITLVHNKGPQQNEEQIRDVLALVERVTETVTQDQLDDEGNVVGQVLVSVSHYELTDLNIPHEVRFYHVIPFGTPKPANLDELDGHKVWYGPGDADKGETRFFNWGLKRGTDHGAEASLYLEDVSKFDPTKLAKKLEKLIDKADPTEFVEDEAGKIATLTLLKALGKWKTDRREEWFEDDEEYVEIVSQRLVEPPLREDLPMPEALSDLKARLQEKGLKVE